MKIYLFNLIFKTKGVRIGGITDANILYFLKYGETYVIPFSSWKGSFKRITEYIAKSMNIGSAICHKDDQHKGYNDKEIEDIIKKISENNQTNGKILGKNITSEKYPHLNSLFSPQDYYEVKEVEETVREYIASMKCPIDGLYGSRFFASKLTFSDSLINENGTFLTHVTINRKTMKAYETEEGGHLFYEEIVRPRNATLKIILRTPSEKELEVWKNTLKFIENEGIQIGAGKSRGLGMLSLDVAESTVYKVGINEKSSTKLEEFLSK